ncbi:MAG: FG-GAP repeat protein [Deltaproteobacteria bacterium]|nr:FG-GAP repeat protein [Deltaproteobacteria bacterium]
MMSKSAGILILSMFIVFISPVSGYPLTYVLPDPSATEIWGEGTGVHSGAALAQGDVNGDGYGDIIIGAPFVSLPGREKAGAVYVIFGGESFPSGSPVDLGAGGASMVIQGAATGDLLGASLGVGDVNGNGIDDIIIGAPGVDTPGTDPAGVAYVIFGNQSLPSSFDLLSTPADVTIVGEQRKWDYNLGIAIAAGDVDGDNVNDIILGFRGANSSAGKVYLVLGKPTIAGVIYLSSSADQKIYGAEAKSLMGDRLASGNINGDAYGLCAVWNSVFSCPR